MKASESLQAVKNLIKDPENWLQYTFAQDHMGMSCSGWDKNACKWCLSAAMDSINPPWPARVFFADALWYWGWNGAIQCNDDGGHSSVMNVLDDAIRRAKIFEGATA